MALLSRQPVNGSPVLRVQRPTSLIRHRRPLVTLPLSSSPVFSWSLLVPPPWPLSSTCVPAVPKRRPVFCYPSLCVCSFPSPHKHWTFIHLVINSKMSQRWHSQIKRKEKQQLLNYSLFHPSNKLWGKYYLFPPSFTDKGRGNCTKTHM